MSSPIQTLDPQFAEKFPSLKIYLEQCDSKLQSSGGGEKRLDPANAVVMNRSNGDGHFEILNQSPSDDFFCAAQIDWRTHEMLIDSGKLSNKTKSPLGALWMSDTCAITKGLVGPEELQGTPCEDGYLDPRLKGLEGMESVKFYLKSCNDLLQGYGEKFGHPYKGEITLDKVRIENPIPKDGQYSLLFTSGAWQFACDGSIDNFSHGMTVTGGHPKNPEKQAMLHGELVDDCTLTRKALGEGEVAGQCINRTQSERNWEKGVDTAKHIFFAGLMVRDVYRWAKGKPTLTGKIWRTVRHPVQSFRGAVSAIQNFSFSGTAARLSTWARGIVPGTRAAISSSRLVTWGRGALTGLRLLAPATGGAAGGGALTTAGAGAGTTALAGGGGVAAGGGVAFTGATVGWCLAAFAAGVGIGVLIEKTPRWLGSKYSVSDGIAWGMTKVFGQPSTKTIDFFERFGFGGWGRFKQIWGID